MAGLGLSRGHDGAERGRRRLLPLVGHLPQAAQRPGLLTSSTRAAAGPPVSGHPAAEGQQDGDDTNLVPASYHTTD